ncbi:hypothetical protein ACJJTC_006103 [Scirpophaga incertulas]
MNQKIKMELLILLSINSFYVYASFDDCVEIMLNEYKLNKSNWTTCETFIENTSFNTNLLLDIEWKTFYYWNCYHEQNYMVRFRKLEPMQIDRFMAIIDKDVNRTVNWNDSELFVEISFDLSGIFIKTATPGRFRFIIAPKFEFENTIDLQFALKLVDGYLGIMNCNKQIAFALAPVDYMPESNQVEEAAAKLNFWNPFGASYLVQINDTVRWTEPVTDLDDDDRVEMEIDKLEHVYQIF